MKFSMKGCVRTAGLFLIILAVLSAVSVPYALAAPSLSGSMSGSSIVAYGCAVKIKVTLSNYGSTAYYSKLTLSVPVGFSMRTISYYIGDLPKGASRTYTFDGSAPQFSTSGTFGAYVTYSDNPWGSGTMYFAWIGFRTVSVGRGNLITFTLTSVTRVVSGTVVISDSSGNYVTAVSGSASGSTGTTRIQVNLLSGYYTASASGKLEKGVNAIGWKSFSVTKDSWIDIYLVPI
jgi:hypothetical protein